jgi:tripartite-type tricarboxylate transporter receptor subunit TctC
MTVVHRRFAASLFIAFALAAAALGAAPARAQAWPSKPVRIIIGYGPGSGADIEARFLSSYLNDAWNNSVIVESRPGASTVIGTDYVAKSAPDGYTVLLSTGGIATYQSLIKNVPVDPLKDLDPVSILNDASPMLLVSNSIPAKTLPEFIAYAKANPGKLNYASAGRNTILLMIESLKQASGIQMTEVPYAGQALYITALLRGDVQLIMASSQAAKPLVDDGRAKVITAFGQARVPNMPNVPTLGEQGYPNLRGSGWYGVLMPHGTPADIVNKFAAEIPKFAATPASKDRAVKGGFVWVASTPAQFREQLIQDVKFWGDIAAKANIKPE